MAKTQPAALLPIKTKTATDLKLNELLRSKVDLNRRIVEIESRGDTHTFTTAAVHRETRALELLGDKEAAPPTQDLAAELSAAKAEVAAIEWAIVLCRQRRD